MFRFGFFFGFDFGVFGFGDLFIKPFFVKL